MKRLTFIGLLAGVVALAQGPHPPGPGGPGGFRGGPGGGFGPHEGGGKVVANLPYSADVTFSRVETLADGNTIQNGASGKVARDLQGRTYSLETLTGGPLGQNGPITRVSIFDPVAGYIYELNTTKKSAFRRQIKTPPNFEGRRHPEGAGPRPTPPNVVVTDLGIQSVNGVSVTGKRTTRTIPAGVMGNSQPLVSITETWLSPDLKVVISSTHTDPRAGKTTYALTNVQPGAPDAALFQVPADYTIKDESHGGRGFGFGGGGPPPPPPGPPGGIE